jgi:glycosyltransferase involved in cell wall biosynthesis
MSILTTFSDDNYVTLAIIIPCYNVQDYVSDAIRSVLSQKSKFDQIILVDDGSTDNTWNEINKFKDIGEIEILKLRKNKGLGYARNFGAKHAHTEFIMFMDSDDLIHPDLVFDFRNHLTSEKDTDMFVYSMIGFQNDIQNYVAERSHIYPGNLSGTGKNILAELIVGNHFHSSSVLSIFKRKLIDWDKAGFYNMLHEDEEFTQRLFTLAKYVKTTDSTYYYYRQSRNGSIMDTLSKFSLNRWMRSKYGYTIGLCSTIYLYFLNFINVPLRRALRLRIKYFLGLTIFEIWNIPLRKFSRILVKQNSNPNIPVI